MSFRALNARVLEPTAQWTMIGGLICLCQPWVEVLHRYGLTIVILGLIGFMVTSKVPAPAPAVEEEEEEQA